MIERVNRRLGEHLAPMPQNRASHHRRFVSHAERDAYLQTFVAGTIPPVCDVSTTRLLPSSSLNSRDTTRRSLGEVDDHRRVQRSVSAGRPATRATSARAGG
jgi:hypothetical protein